MDESQKQTAKKCFLLTTLGVVALLVIASIISTLLSN